MVVKKRAGLGKGLDALLGKKEVVITLSEAGGDASSELDIEKKRKKAEIHSELLLTLQPECFIIYP